MSHWRTDQAGCQHRLAPELSVVGDRVNINPADNIGDYFSCSLILCCSNCQYIDDVFLCSHQLNIARYKVFVVCEGVHRIIFAARLHQQQRQCEQKKCLESWFAFHDFQNYLQL